MGRHEMNHALELDRQLAHRLGRADSQRLEEIARELHAALLFSRVEAQRAPMISCKSHAKFPAADCNEKSGTCHCNGIFARLITLPQSSASSAKNLAASARLLLPGSI